MIEWLWTFTEVGMAAAAATFVTASLTATGRPGATVFLILAVPTALLHAGIWEAHDWFLPPTHVAVLGGLGIWAVVEHFLRGEIYGELIEALPIDSIGAMVLLWLLFVGQTALGDAPATGAPDVAAGLKQAMPLGPGLVLLGLTLPLQLAVGWMRNRVFDVMRDMGFGGSLAVLEFFGVAGLVVGVLLVPTAALGVAIFVVVPVVIGMAVSGAADVYVDRSRREACPSCGHSARIEASRCPGCRSRLAVKRSLSASGTP